MRETTKNNNTGIRWQMMSKLEDLNFFDDTAMLSSTHSQMQSKTNSMSGLAKRVVLKINEKKTKTLRLNNRNVEPVKLEGKDIEDVEFIYLGAVVSKEGGGGKDMDSRLNKARTAIRSIHKTEQSVDLKPDQQEKQNQIVQIHI